MPRAAPALMLALGFSYGFDFQNRFYFLMYCKEGPQVMPIYEGATKC